MPRRLGLLPDWYTLQYLISMPQEWVVTCVVHVHNVYQAGHRLC